MNRSLAITLFCFVGLFACNSSEDLILDVVGLKNNTMTEVREKLGQPDSTYQRSIYGVEYLILEYDENKGEFRFLNDTIAQIILNEPAAIDFSPVSITKFGFEMHPPVKVDENATIMWQNIEGIRDVNFYKVGKRNEQMKEAYFRIYFNMQ